jgi:exonuclease III
MDVRKYCSERDIKACVLKLKLSTFNIYTVTVYRAPCGNFNSFLNGLDSIIKSIDKIERKLIICGDINIDYLTVSDRRRQLDALLLSYNLTATVKFPTRVQNQSSTAIDNIFINNYKFTKYTVSPIYNGLLDHDAQLLTIKDINIQ